jgi:hypothetical protein
MIFSVRAELVEAPNFLFGIRRKGQLFDKLRADGFGELRLVKVAAL